MMLQEYLFRTALMELGMEPTELHVNHLTGEIRLGDHVFGLKYPVEYVRRIDELPLERKYRYVFSGSTEAHGNRLEALEAFQGPNSHLETNLYGRNETTKYTFNVEYYSLLRSSYFSLCPHQAYWPGPKELAWTYRFIESAFSKTLPIVFRKLPCGKRFLDGFEFFWDDEEHDLKDYEEKLEHNRKLAEERFLISLKEQQTLGGKR